MLLSFWRLISSRVTKANIGNSTTTAPINTHGGTAAKNRLFFFLFFTNYSIRKILGAKLEWSVSLISVSVSRNIENNRQADAQAFVFFSIAISKKKSRGTERTRDLRGLIIDSYFLSSFTSSKSASTTSSSEAGPSAC